MWHGRNAEAEIVELSQVRAAAGYRLGALAAREIGLEALGTMRTARVLVLRWAYVTGAANTTAVAVLDAQGRNLARTPEGRELLEAVDPVCAWLDEKNMPGWRRASPEAVPGWEQEHGCALLDLRAALQLHVPPGPVVAAPPDSLFGPPEP